MNAIDASRLIKDTKTLHLSTQRTSSILENGEYKSKASYDVRGYLNFENDDTIEYVSVEMPYAVLCNSNYIINENNNTLVMFYGATTYTYTLSQGNYTASTFITELYKYLTQAAGWTITQDTVRNIYTFKYSVGQFSILAQTTCDYVLGFTGTQTSTASAPYTLTMPRVFNFLPIPRYVIHCNVLNDGILLGTNGQMGSSDILATIPNNAKLNGQIIYETTATEFIVKTHNWPLITITITDDNNRLINFNGISSYFVLKFNIYRKTIQKPLAFQDLVQAANKVIISDMSQENI